MGKLFVCLFSRAKSVKSSETGYDILMYDVAKVNGTLCVSKITQLLPLHGWLVRKKSTYGLRFKVWQLNVQLTIWKSCVQFILIACEKNMKEKCDRNKLLCCAKRSSFFQRNKFFRRRCLLMYNLFSYGFKKWYQLIQFL